MKKYFRIILPALLLGIITFMGYTVFSKINYKKEVAENIKRIPVFSYPTLKGTLFSNQNLKEDMAVVFFYFNSECEFCQEEAELIQMNIEKLKNIQLIFISTEESKTITEFSEQYQLSEYDNVCFLCDTKADFSALFDVKSLPSVILYDKNKNLIEKVKGQIKIESIIEKVKG